MTAPSNNASKAALVRFIRLSYACVVLAVASASVWLACYGLHRLPFLKTSDRV
jgi:hypothetical protein